MRILSKLHSPTCSFSSKLCLAILLLAAPVFIVALSVLFIQSRNMIRKDAVGRANSVLSATMQHIYRNLSAVETATNANSWLVEQAMTPEGLLALSNHIVKLNPHTDGCSISAEPNLFPQYGRYFSAYSIRKSDTVMTVVEEQYEYFDKIWYKKPFKQKAPCWVVYFDESDTLKLTLDGMVASYGRPLYNADSCFIGVITADLSLLHLSKTFSQMKPYPNSYFMMVDEEGRYLIHPDSTRLFNTTIFSNVDPKSQADIIALGHEMTVGNEGSMYVNINGEPCQVCYQPVPGTPWSLAIICPDSDVLKAYHKQAYILGPLLILGLIAILFFCYRAVAHSIRPLNLLLDKTQSIAAGDMDIYIRQTGRTDVIGRLQNSFATMLQSLQFHMGSVRYTSDQTKRRNEELLHVTRLACEAEKQKAAFIQNVSHQIRTPLNIVMGFAEILSIAASNQEERLSEEEMKSIISTMNHNSGLLYRMVLMLFDSSDTGHSQELSVARQQEQIFCNALARETITYIRRFFPNLEVGMQSEVSDDYSIHTNRTYLERTLRELIYNSAKYSDGQHILLCISVVNNSTRISIEDTGKGIDAAYQEQIFKFFTKIDDLTEGLGLGLPLAKRHIQNLGGDLTLDTDYHDGCRFIIEIPS